MTDERVQIVEHWRFRGISVTICTRKHIDVQILQREVNRARDLATLIPFIIKPKETTEINSKEPSLNCGKF